MVEAKRTCPECNLIFQASLPETGVLTCPLCDTVFSARPSAGTVPFAPATSTPLSSPIASAQHVWKGCLAVAALLFLVGGLVYAYRLIGGIEPQTTRMLPTPTVAPPPSEPPPVPPIRVFQPALSPPQPMAPLSRPSRLASARKPPPMPAEAPPPLTLPERINRAIDGGVAYLRKRHNGHDQYRNYL